MATTYLPADRFPLIRLARLVDQCGRGEATAAALGEVRQLEDRFGLSPLARRRLQWEIAQAGQQAQGRPLAPIRRIRAVDPTEIHEAGGINGRPQAS
jgi:hypothetical protein